MDRFGRDTPSDNDRDTPKDVGDAPTRVDTPGPLPKHIYTREKLLELEQSKACRIKPACLAEEYFTLEGLWDPERWFRSFDLSRNNSPLTIDRDKKREIDRDYMNKRRPSDPKERLKEEKDGIVLSPQRRSFGTGCHVTQLPLTRQISCPSDFKDGSDRDRDRGSRRIGSGRIQLDRDRDIPRERGERDIRAIRDRFDRDDRDRRFDRERDRGFGRREYDDRRGDFNRHYNNGAIRQRRDSYRNHGDDEEPEWFTSGPTSQTDTIELHGFDKNEEKAKKKRTEEENNVQKEVVVVKEEEEVDVILEDDEESQLENKDITDVAGVIDRNGSLETNEASSPEESNHSDSLRNTSPPTNIFDFNEFFKIDNLPGLNEGASPSTDIPVFQSRFSQWFANKSKGGSHGNSQENSRRSSLNDDFGYLNDLLGGSRSPIIPSPPPPSVNSMLDQSVFSINSTFADKPQHHSMDLSGLNKSSITPMLSAIFQNHYEKRSMSPANKLNFSTQDAEAQLKAMLFGRKDSTPSSSGTASPSVHSPLNVLGRVKTVAELEADMKPQPGPTLPSRCFTPPQAVPSPSVAQQQSFSQKHPLPPQQMQQQLIQPQPMPTPMMPATQPPPKPSQDEGDLTAFNKLLSLMKAGAAAAVESPKLVAQQENHSVSPPAAPPPQPMLSQIPNSQAAAAAAQNEFLQALQRNKEQQLQIRQQTMNQMQMRMQGKPLTPQQLQALQAQPTQPLGTQRPPGPSQAANDPIINFIKQNPTIITKPASPTPPPQSQPQPPPQAPSAPTAMMGVLQSTSTPRAPSPSAQLMQQNLLPQAPSSPRVPSPIMFGQQPPMHLSAPSPIHPTQLTHTSPMTVPVASTLTANFSEAQSGTSQPVVSDNIDSTATIRPPVIPRVPSPQELIARTQAIMQTALLKKQLEDQKERFIRKQQERAKSPNPMTQIALGQNPATIKSASQPVSSTPITYSSNQTQNKTSVTAAFTPTSVIRKMHSDKATEKEKQKQDNQEEGSSAPKAPIKQLVLHDGTINTGDREQNQSNVPSEDTASKAFSNSLQFSGATTSSHDAVIASLKTSTSTDSGIPHDMPTTLAEQLSQLSNPMSPQKQPARAVTGQRSIQNNVTPLPTNVPVQTPGRAIVKGIGGVQTGTPSTTQATASSRQVMGQPTTPQVNKEQTPLIPTTHPTQGQPPHRAIIGVSSVPTSHPGVVPAPTLDITKIPQQRQFNPSPNPLTRPITGTPVAATPGVPFGIPITGRIPVQPAIPTNPLMMQQMLAGISPTAARVNALNQLNALNHVNQLNQLALQAQQPRIVDPRIQGGIRGVYPAVPSISPRSSVGASTTSLGVPVGTTLGINVATSRALSPQAPTQKSLINGPMSPGIPMHSMHSGFLNGNNNIGKQGDPHLAKWFGTDVLKTQLSNMPPLPPQGQRVMTLEEIERCQQAVTN